MSKTDDLELTAEFAENPEPRCACVLLLDTSGSMAGTAIQSLNEGLKAFKADVIKDSLASRRLEIAVVSFDSEVKVVQDFVTVDQFEPPMLAAGGTTSMGAGVMTALDMIQARKGIYKSNGIAYYRPWVFMITDGEPQGEPAELFQAAAQRVKDDENHKRIAFFAVGVEGAHMQKLADLATRAPVKLLGLNFVDMFVWLSRSVQEVAHSKTDDMVALPPPGWGTV
jgi:uncharacterized protein YegL